MRVQQLLVSGLGVIAALLCIAVSMYMNFIYGHSLGATPAMGLAWGLLSLASDTFKALCPLFIYWALRNRRWMTAAVACVGLVFAILYALISATGFASESKRAVIGGRESVRAAFLDVEAELEEVTKRRAGISATRSTAEIEAAITAVLGRSVKDGNRLRGTIATISLNCTRADARTIDACKEVNDLRQQLAAATSAQSLDQKIERLRKSLRELRDKGGSADANPGASLLSRMTFGRLSVADVEDGKTIFLAILVEFMSTFGLLIALEHSDLRQVARDMRTQRRERRADTQPSAEISSPRAHVQKTVCTGPTKSIVATTRGSGTANVIRFLDARLVPAKDKAVEVGALYLAFCDWCAAEAATDVGFDEFTDVLAIICRQIKIGTKENSGQVYCVDVAIAA